MQVFIYGANSENSKSRDTVRLSIGVGRRKKLYGLSVLAGFQCAGTNGVFSKLNGSLDLALVPSPRPELQRVGFFVWNG
jgi:hypothetical protein